MPGHDNDIVYRDITKRFGDLEALKGVSTTLKGGHVTALLGPNGAGKTTLISLALGLLLPTKGTVSIGSAPAGSLSARQKLGAVLQDTSLPDQLTVREHLSLFAKYHANPMTMDQIIFDLNLDGIIDRKYGHLSGGQKKRAQLAVALIGNPSFLILDEPTVGLDAEARETLWLAVRRIAAEGCAILLCTHYLEEAEALADHLILLAEGEIRAEGPLDALRSRFTTSSIRFAAVDHAADLITALPGVQRVAVDGRFIRLETDDAEETLKALIAAHIPLRDLTVQQSSLKSLIDQHTNGSAHIPNAEIAA